MTTDTTMIKHTKNYYDLTMYVDVFNNEIVSYDLVPGKSGSGTENHYIALKKLLEAKETRRYSGRETIIHSDQGTIYTSKALGYFHKDRNIRWSMSRAGTPTDNPVIESINGWMKDELYADFNLEKSDNIHETVHEYIQYYNNERYAYALKYKNPSQYRIDLGFR